MSDRDLKLAEYVRDACADAVPQSEYAFDMHAAVDLPSLIARFRAEHPEGRTTVAGLDAVLRDFPDANTSRLVVPADDALQARDEERKRHNAAVRALLRVATNLGIDAGLHGHDRLALADAINDAVQGLRAEHPEGADLGSVFARYPTSIEEAVPFAAVPGAHPEGDVRAAVKAGASCGYSRGCAGLEGHISKAEVDSIASRVLARSPVTRPATEEEVAILEARGRVGLPVVIETCGQCPMAHQWTDPEDAKAGGWPLGGWSCAQDSDLAGIEPSTPPPAWCPLRSTPKPGGG